MDWHNSLPAKIKLAMNYSLREWDYQLLAEYKPNTGEAFIKAKALRFRFDD